MPEPLTHAAYDTPFGDLHVFADARGVVRASGFRDAIAIAAHLPAALYSAGWVEGELPAIERAVEAWLEGDGEAITTVQVEQEGGPFFQELWAALRRVRAGEPLTYKELAEAAGRPNAMRAAGTACARNAVAPFVPCHRVLSAGHKVGAYGYGGSGMKAAMLTLEAGGSPAQVRAAAATGPGAVAPALASAAGSHA